MTALLRMLALALTIFAPLAALAQDQAKSAAQPKPAAASSDQLLKPEQLDALVAPIALYPDNLLSLVLMASTYPLELVQADRWMKENKKIKGDELKVEVNKQAWDENVKALVATPDVLAMMSTKLDWTVKLGDAVLAQQPDVMDAIQRLRSRADANNKLSSTNEQKVVKQQQQGKQIISIEPTNPNTVYVPYYDPAVVYGGWPYPAYPPYYFGYPGYIPGGLIATGLAFGAGYAMGRWASGGNYWGGGFNWNNNNININRPQVNPLGGNNWQHRPEHRQGVRYDNPRVQQRFGSNNIGNGAQNRMDFRGRGGDQVLRPGGGEQRPGAGQRPGGAQRPSADQRPSGGRSNTAQRPSGARAQPSQRPSGGQRNAGARPSSRPSGGNALGNIGSGQAANRSSARGQASMGGRAGGGSFARAGGGARGGGGGGGARSGGGGGRGGGGGGGGGRRSDIAVKHDIVLLGHLANGLGYYKFSYNGSDRAYVGVIAQEVQQVKPTAAVRDKAGYLRVFYDKLGIKFQTYKHWLASGARLPAVVPNSP